MCYEITLLIETKSGRDSLFKKAWFTLALSALTLCISSAPFESSDQRLLGPYKTFHYKHLVLFERELAPLAAVQVENLGKPEEAEGTIYKSLDCHHSKMWIVCNDGKWS